MRRLVQAFLLACFLVVPYASPAQASSLVHSPIWIRDDSEFTEANGVVAGSGVPSDPYVIEGWDISVLGSNVFFAPGARAGILVEDTRAHFVIRNVFVHDGPTSSANVALKNVSNGRVEESQISRGNIGILLWLANKSAVMENDVQGVHSAGVELDLSFENQVEGNSIRDTASFPIFVRLSSSNKFLRNVVERAGGGILNGNSSFNLFQENTIRETFWGISMGADSHSNVVRENLIQDVERSGVTVGFDTSGNLIEGNIIFNAGRGVLLNQAFLTRVHANHITAVARPGAESVTGSGVRVVDSSNSWITGNTILAPTGITICRSRATHLAPPPNDLSGSSLRIVNGPKACP